MLVGVPAVQVWREASLGRAARACSKHAEDFGEMEALDAIRQSAAALMRVEDNLDRSLHEVGFGPAKGQTRVSSVLRLPRPGRCRVPLSKCRRGCRSALCR